MASTLGLAHWLIQNYCPAIFPHFLFDGGGGKGENTFTMKMKDALLALCVVALLIAAVFVFVTNDAQKRAALVQAATARHDADQARADLDQLKTATATQMSDDARLRSENQRLSQKITQLQTLNDGLNRTNLWLLQQYGSLHDVAVQQQGQLQQMQTQNQIDADRRACIANLRQINVAKAAWALENNKSADAVPTEADLLPYFPNGVFPVCPSGGTYSINAVGDSPTCTIPGHVLPQQ